MNQKKRRPLEGYICFALLITMTLVMFVGVVFRYVFNSSLSWSEELSRYLFIWFIFLSTSYAVTEKAHIRVESLNRVVPKKIRPYINIVGKIIWFALGLFVTYLGIKYAMTMNGSVSAAMKIPMSIVYLGIPLGYFLMSLRLLSQIIESIKNPEIEIEDIYEEFVVAKEE